MLAWVAAAAAAGAKGELEAKLLVSGAGGGDLRWKGLW